MVITMTTTTTMMMMITAMVMTCEMTLYQNITAVNSTAPRKAVYCL